jgi:hypothetical protein
VLLQGSIAFSTLGFASRVNAISPRNRSLSRLVMKYTISSFRTKSSYFLCQLISTKTIVSQALIQLIFLCSKFTFPYFQSVLYLPTASELFCSIIFLAYILLNCFKYKSFFILLLPSYFTITTFMCDLSFGRHLENFKNKQFPNPSSLNV